MGTQRWLRVPLAEIGFVRAIYEGYDGMCTLSAPAGGRGELVLWIAPGYEALADEVERRLTRSAALQRIPDPGNAQVPPSAPVHDQ